MRWLLGLTIGAALGGAVGCGVDPSGTGGGGGTGTGGNGGASPCDDPVNGPVPEDCGVWVSASQGNDANPGTQAKPVASLAHAVELARSATGHVYACAETFGDPLVIPGNIGIHGGFDCENGWAYLGTKKRSILASPPDEIALVVSDDGNGGISNVTDFHIESADAAKPGGSSIAMLVRKGMGLIVRRCEVFAGDAMDGADGTPADPQDNPASDGPPGNVGAAACSASLSKGGTSPESACASGATSKGGSGGDGAPMTATDGASGEPPTANPAEGAGGLGEANAPVCTDGKPGAVGAVGEHGKGAQGLTDEVLGQHLGRLTPNGYEGMAGEDGQPAAPGQGGGGGGATFGSVAVCGASKPGGAAGGSGGAGGCGGQGGRRWAARRRQHRCGPAGQTRVLRVAHVRGQRGNGGNGAPGQPGGQGGAGGPGGAGSGTIKAACAGGPGGNGGRGGWGGGGQGGPSAGLAYGETQVNLWLLGTDPDSSWMNFRPEWAWWEGGPDVRGLRWI